ncbi:MAG: AMP-binding protein [Patescibacteria group bacterium]
MKSNILAFKNFNDFWLDRVHFFGDQTCLVDGEHPDVSYSYQELNDFIDRTALLLVQFGLRSGDCFGIITRNRPEFFFLYLASLKLGTLIMPIAVDSPHNLIQSLITTFNISLLFHGIPEVEQAKKVKTMLGSRPLALLALDELRERLSKIKPKQNLYDETRLDCPGSLYFSSGTTGVPKGIPQSPKNLLVSAWVLGRAYRFTAADTQMGIMPCYHTALATCGFLPGLTVGSAFVLYERFHCSTFWSNLAISEASFVNVVPTVLSILLKESPATILPPLPKLKFIGSASAPLPVSLQEQFEFRFGVRISNQHGLSETGALFFNPAEPERRRLGAIGLPTGMPIESRLITTTGREVAQGEVGEIAVRGPNVIDDYYRNEAETALAWRDGWFCTGDLAYKDESGFYFMIGRSKEMINRGGAKISPLEVDNVILVLAPKVNEVATVGIPDSLYGEDIVSFVVASKPNESLMEEIKTHCTKYLPSYKCPREIIFIDKIPQTASGKIFRRQLIAEYIKQHEI